MTNKELQNRFAEIEKEISALKEERKRLTWEFGIPAIIAKMKELGKSEVDLRLAEDDFNYCTEDLWGMVKDGTYAVRILKLNDDDTLSVLYNTFWEIRETYEERWEYEDDDMETEVDRLVSDNIISNILPDLLDDDIYNFQSDDEEDD